MRFYHATHLGLRTLLVLLALAVGLLLVRACEQNDLTSTPAKANQPMVYNRVAPDTVRHRQPAPVAALPHVDLPVAVHTYAPDTTRRKQAERKPILTRVSRRTEGRFLGRKRHYVDIERIEPNGVVITEVHQLPVPEAPFTVDGQTGQVAIDHQAEVKAGRKKTRRRVGQGLGVGILLLVVAFVAGK